MSLHSFNGQITDKIHGLGVTVLDTTSARETILVRPWLAFIFRHVPSRPEASLMRAFGSCKGNHSKHKGSGKPNAPFLSRTMKYDGSSACI